jgi:hypothetical protein
VPTPTSTPTSAAGPTTPSPAAALQIAFRSQPDPPKAGDNRLEVTVSTPEGTPIDDGEVAVTFFMAAMPAMNMPAMRSEAKLTPAGSGVYRGSAAIATPGRWEVTVVVSRGGRRIGAKQLTVVTR